MTNRPGTLNVVYFVRGTDGFIMLAPYTAMPTLPGYRREVANTLGEVDVLQRKLIEQETRALEQERVTEEAAYGKMSEAVRDRLYARMTSTATDEYEKDFIREYLKLRDENKRKKYAEAFEHRRMYLWAREFDSPKDRRSDEERVDVDRIG